MSDRVLLMAVDGLDWRLLRAEVAAGRMPHLGRMLCEGAFAELAVKPLTVGIPGAEEGMLSPVLWTTIASGQYYFQHGVYGFSHVMQDPVHPPLFESGHVLTPRIWDVLSAHGLSSIVVGYYVTHPAYPILGVMVSDLFGEVENADAAWPAGRADELAAALGFPDYAGLVAGMASVEREAQAREADTAPDAVAVQRQMDVLRRFTGLEPGEIDRLLHGDDQRLQRKLVIFRLVYPFLRDQRFHQVLLHLLSNTDWRFATVYYRLLDFVSHGFWPHPAQQDDQFARRYGQVLSRAYQWIDACLGQLRAQLDPTDRLIVVSDHGFQANDRFTAPEGVKDIAEVAYGQHAEPAVLLAAGGPRRGQVQGASMLDIAPTIYDYFSIPQAESLDGGPVPGLLSGDALRTFARVPAYAYDPPGATAGMTRGEEEAVLRRLSALGYID